MQQFLIFGKNAHKLLVSISFICHDYESKMEVKTYCRIFLFLVVLLLY